MSNLPNVDIYLGNQHISAKKKVVDQFGVALILTEAPAGWYDLPPSSSSVTSNQYSDGGVANISYYAPRPITLVGEIWADNRTALIAAIDRLKRTLRDPNALIPLTFIEESGKTLTCMVRPEGTQSIKPIGGISNDGKFSLQLVAPDPRQYGPTVERTVSAITT